jgi:selenocysteine lyase/cysteine desulfurase
MTIDIDRRGLMAAGLMLGVAGAAKAAPVSGAPTSATDQAYWRGVAGQYDVTREVIQLENGNWGMMARPVLQAYERNLEMVNRRNSFYGRREYNADLARAQARVAANLGVQVDEIVFTRGATESLMTLIGGYNRLRPGDQILYADLDYDSTQGAFRSLKSRRGVDVVTINLPEPASHQGLIDAYAAALAANPRVRLMLLTHVSHRTGLVVPVAEIVALARSRGVDVIVDSAHAWGQLDFKVGDLGADFVGLTCQKWIGAPIGVGVMYVRKSRIADIDPAMGNDEEDAGADIRRRVHAGTSNFAAYLTVPAALDFQEAIGAKAKEARLRLLRDRWAEPLRGHGRIEILTPSDPRLTCAITSFRLRGETSVAGNRVLVADLLKRFKIFTVERSGVASGACIRVTPALFNTEADIDDLVAALTRMA